MRLNKIYYLAGFLTLALLMPFGQLDAQNVFKWLSVGSLHNWYADIGCEREEALKANQQQNGWQWPAQFNYQDVQAAKGFWIGTKDFTEEDGTFRQYKVVHCGPRPYKTNENEFFPVKFETYARFAPSKVYVDGAETYQEDLQIDHVDPNLPCDVMHYNEVNTQIGVTMKRKIFQFSQPFHDNYIVIEYTFINTGNTDKDAEIERPNVTLKDVYFYNQYRIAINRETRVPIGNSSGWGVNTMIDARGDGLKQDTDNPERLRFMYAYHGRYTQGTFEKGYDNLGAPIFKPAGTFGDLIDKADTVGRLAAPQFPGILTLHADVSATDKSDNPGQPATTSYESSDDQVNFNNDAFNSPKMAQEYAWMSRGHKSPRHADFIEPSGNFAEPTGDPSNQSTNGAGYSIALGYGPYTLAPGDSITIVQVEGAAGISRDKAIEIGKKYKQKQITSKEKNIQFLTGKDSLISTFSRAKAAYDNGWNIPQAPLPPSDFNVKSSGGRIELSWGVYPENTKKITGFEIYRSITNDQNSYSAGKWATKYDLVATVGPDARSYQDTSGSLNFAYYYYIVSVGDPSENTGAGKTPAGALRSSRFYTQTYEPAYKQKPGAPDLNNIRVVPNPYIINGAKGYNVYPGEPNKITFSNLTGDCTIKIYTELGELIKTIEHSNGSSEEYWYSTTSSNQFIVSGIYIAVVTDKNTGSQKIAKFVVIR